jgi:hypothetical protein
MHLRLDCEIPAIVTKSEAEAWLRQFGDLV